MKKPKNDNARRFPKRVSPETLTTSNPTGKNTKLQSMTQMTNAKNPN